MNAEAEKIEEQASQEPTEVCHYHAIITNAGIPAKLPAVATKQIALEVLVYWIGPRISPLHVATLSDSGVATGTGLGTVCIIDCNCKDPLVTREDIKKSMDDVYNG